MAKNKDPYRLPKTPLIQKAVQELMDCAEVTEIYVRTRAAHILYYDCKPADTDLMAATLLFDFMTQEDLKEEFNPKVAAYARDMKWFQQQPMGIIMAAPSRIKSFYLAINLAATEIILEEFIEDLQNDPYADPEDLLDMQDMLTAIYRYIGDLPYPKLMNRFNALCEEIDEICFGEMDDTPAMPAKPKPAIKPTGDIKAWIRKNGRKPS